MSCVARSPANGRPLLAGADVYGQADANDPLYAERVEEHIAVYDRQMLEYAKRVVGEV